ncbi:RNA polymerase factor sigma-54 [Spirochaetia bacterium 38H-sp]|uniref:RNA polymerase factor sigma-54 n=1 Tax=Rarispira pelagica TaxID=3141764 RepID=A0ABU9U9E0_9SPIR
MQSQRNLLTQTQKLTLTPQLLQSIQILHLPLADLRQMIYEQVEINPALEIKEEKGELSLDAAKEQPENYEYFEDSSDPGFSHSSNTEEDSRRMFLEGAFAAGTSLHEHLIWQLRLRKDLSEKEIEIGELIINNLDERGFHIEEPSKLVKTEQEKKIAEKLIGIIQELDPQGCATKDYVESLIIQARLRGDAPEILEDVLGKYLSLLEKGKYKEIAKKLRVGTDEVLECLTYIKLLNPFPGILYSASKPHYVIPDLEVKNENGSLVIIINDEEIPVLGINDFFASIKNSDSKEVKKFVKEKVREAEIFINSIYNRNSTLLKVARAIVEFQRDFFIRGPQYLAPLTLKDVAETVEMHETTISRVTTNKYVQTEWGIFELKHFFTNSISGSGSGGSRYSKESVKHIIRDIIEEEVKKSGKSLSDSKLAELLKKRGISIARRTVAKYRKELNIRSSFERESLRRIHED